MTRYRRLGISSRRCVAFAVACSAILLSAGHAVWARGKPQDMGEQNSASAGISDLQGNVTGGSHIHISGTNVSVHLIVRGSWKNTYHGCTVYLGSQVLAAGKSHVRADPGYSGNWSYFVTDSAGNWQGTIMFDSTGLPTGTGGEAGTYLKLKALPIQGDPPATGDPVPKGADLCSNAMPYVQVYNMAYVISNNDVDDSYGTGVSAHLACESMNHAAAPEDLFTTHPVKSTMLGDLPNCTLFVHVSHGLWNVSPYYGETILFDAVYDPDDPDKNSVAAHGMPKSAVPDQDEWPMQPHYNMALSAACYSAGDPQDAQNEYHKDMAQGFEILLWADCGAKANRAYLGWVGPNYACNLPFFAAVVQELASGKTIYNAVQKADEDHAVLGVYRVYGDRSATLHSVYSGVMAEAP